MMFPIFIPDVQSDQCLLMLDCLTTTLPEGRRFPLRLFEGFSGYLQTDGYASYAVVCKQEGITQVGCRDHCRRKFTDAKKDEAKDKSKKLKNQKASKADFAPGKICKLYAIEDEVKGPSADEKTNNACAVSRY